MAHLHCGATTFAQPHCTARPLPDIHHFIWVPTNGRYNTIVPIVELRKPTNSINGPFKESRSHGLCIWRDFIVFRYTDLYGVYNYYIIIQV